jgi:predicted transcriptional regulator
MNYELKDIKALRKKFELTQTQLAKKSGVSQSLIAKIEAGKLDPTYTNAKKIFAVLESMRQKQEVKVEAVMVSKPISVAPDADVQEVIRCMKKYDISQVLVIDKEKIVGYITESDVLDALSKADEKIKAKDMMEDAPPLISKNALITIASELLKFYPIIAVVENNSLVGIVTKADILKQFYKEHKEGLF